MLASRQYIPSGEQLGEAELAQKNYSILVNHQRRIRQYHGQTDACDNPFGASVELSRQATRVQSFHGQSDCENSAGRRGIIEAFVKICERWGLGTNEQLILLGYQPDDVVGQHVLAGRVVPWTQDVRDRAGYVVSISLGLGALFEEITEAEVDWLNYGRSQFRGKSPLEHMLEGSMSQLFSVSEMVKHERGL